MQSHSPFFARAPGSTTPNGAGARTPSNSHSAYFTAPDHSSQVSSSYSSYGSEHGYPGPPPPQHHASGSSPAFYAPRSSSPSTSFRQVNDARPYPLVQQRSFRDVSSSGDMVIPRDELSVNSGGSTKPGGAGGGGASWESSATSRGGRITPTSSVGAIGDGRKVSSSSPDKNRPIEELLGGLASVFDQRGGLGFGSAGDNNNNNDGSTVVKSRPSSFILDVLPAQLDQARDRSAGGSNAGSFSLDFHTPSSPSPSNQNGNIGLSSAPPASSSMVSESALFHSPTSTTAPLLPSTAAPSTSRSSSPIPLESSTPSSTALDSLNARVTSLESSVTNLSSLVNNEVRSLRDEVGVLRGLVLQSSQGVNGRLPHPLDRNQFDRGGETDSPMLTVRSPSPTHDSTFPPPLVSTSLPSSNRSSGIFQHQVQVNTPTPVSNNYHLGSSPAPPSPALSAPGGLYSEADSKALASKDDQIRSLTQQINALTMSVSQLMASTASQQHGTPQLHQQHQQQQQAQNRQSSLPAFASPSLSSLVDGWKREIVGGTTGLGVSAPGGLATTGPSGGARSPLIRPVSSGGINRNGGPGSQFGRSVSTPLAGTGGGFGRVDGSFETGSNSTWDGGLSAASPQVGAMGSPLLGNPPGSLGGKWEVLGIGTELFRTIAKYGLGPPTKIQAKAIPCVVRREDIVAQAPSIQERIQSYIVPALQLICTAAAQASLEGVAPASKGIQVVVVTATVDQAAQAQRLSVGLGGSLGIRTSLCVSNGDLQQDLQTFLKSPPHVLVGTPQRLLDLFATRTLSTVDIRLLVIDECDQLIARNLSEHVVNLVRLLPASGGGNGNAPSSPILSRSPMLGGPGGLPGAFGSNDLVNSPRVGSTVDSNGRQTAIFSCTVPQDVLNFASSLQLKEPVRVLVRREGGGGESSVPSVRGLKQYYLYIAVGNSATQSKAVGVGRREANTAREWKLEALADVLEDYPFEHAVVFCSSVEAVEAVSYKLGARGIEPLALVQDMGQSSRNNILAKFRATNQGTPRTGAPLKRCLVVYDVLCRTLTDVQVPLVVNYDLPRAVEDYVHRIACATPTGYARAGSGVVVNVVTSGPDVEMLRNIEQMLRIKIQELPPSFAST